MIDSRYQKNVWLLSTYSTFKKKKIDSKIPTICPPVFSVFEMFLLSYNLISYKTYTIEIIE